MTRYDSAIDIDAIVAIDTHVHIEVDAHGHSSMPAELSEAASKYFSTQGPRPDLDSIAAYYRERRMAAVVFTVDAQTQLQHPPVDSAAIADGAARNNDVLIPYGSVDPRRPDALDRVRRLVDESGVRGFKFHPTVQGFDPYDRFAWPIYEVIAEYKLPAIFHTGHSGIGSGMPRGGGLKVGRSNPMLLEDVAIDFSDMQIVMAHPSWPWQDEALSLCLHKPNMWIDLSGWSPRYFPPQLVQYANTLLKERVLFGSDFPLISPDRWLKDFDKAGFKPEVQPLILKENARRLLGLV